MISATATKSEAILAIVDRLSHKLARIKFEPPVDIVYNPLQYARAPYAEYLEKFANGNKEAVLLGMNPGPWGMVQNGIPFGEVKLAKEWLGLSAPIRKPKLEHPKRPVLGWNCTRSEVSGARLWGWARDTFGTPQAFFRRFIVLNYCPLAFLENSGANRTPDKIPMAQRKPLLEACDTALTETIEIIQPQYVIGVGGFALKRAQMALGDSQVTLGGVLHPSPASPAANKGWAKIVSNQLQKLGIKLSE